MESATTQFWRHGFHATTAEDLCQATGLGRSSLYNTFGSKEGLFAECLSGYLSQAQERAVNLLSDDTRGPLGRIEAWLTQIATEEIDRSSKGGPRGCFGINTVAELTDDPDAAATIGKLRHDLDTRLALLEDVIRVGQIGDEITRDASPESLAAYINSSIAGLRIASQGGASPNVIMDAARMTVRALRP